MKSYSNVFIFCLMLTLIISCGQGHTAGNIIVIKSDTIGLTTSRGPKGIIRDIVQDKKGNIWIAAFDGIFLYDGKSFTNVTSKISKARFFSILEDKKGNFWFGSIGAGVFYYDGRSVTNFTTKDGLLNNEVTNIFLDKKGDIWFGVSGGASQYNGRSFQNYIIDGEKIYKDQTGKTFTSRQPYEVSSIAEDYKGKFWLATRGNTFVYDGKTFTAFTHNGKPFKNVRSIIEDKNKSIWLAGADGFWRYNGSSFANLSKDFTGSVYQDSKGNILTTSQRANEGQCLLSKYDGKSLTDKTPAVTEIVSKYAGNKGMIFKIFEARDGTIYLGTMTGLYRYDGKHITDL